jgi:dihydrofolate reductase
MDRKVVVYIAASIDGYIAGPGEDMSFLSLVEAPEEDYGYLSFIQTVDTVIMGRKTYDWVMTQVTEFPHKDKETFIITRNPKPDNHNLHFYSGSLKQLIHDLKMKKGKNIFVDGGAEIVNELLKLKLIDELIISVIPVILGGGTLLFKSGTPYQTFELVSVKSFESGLVQSEYRKT